MPERAYLGNFYDPENNAEFLWSENDYRFNALSRVHAKIELSMALHPRWWSITAGVIGFLAAGLVSAFLPLAKGVYAPLSDVVSTAILFATGLIEYWIMRVNARCDTHGQPPNYMYKRTIKSANISEKDYDRKDDARTFDRRIRYCVGVSQEERERQKRELTK